MIAPSFITRVVQCPWASLGCRLVGSFSSQDKHKSLGWAVLKATYSCIVIESPIKIRDHADRDCKVICSKILELFPWLRHVGYKPWKQLLEVRDTMEDAYGSLKKMFGVYFSVGLKELHVQE